MEIFTGCKGQGTEVITKRMVVADYVVTFLIHYFTVLYLSTSDTSGLIVSNKCSFFLHLLHYVRVIDLKRTTRSHLDNSLIL